MRGRPSGDRPHRVLVGVVGLVAICCAPADPACEIEPTTGPVPLDEERSIEIEVAEALVELASDGVYLGPQFEPLDHGGVIWESPEIIADGFRPLPGHLSGSPNPATATLVSPDRLQVVVSDGTIITLRPADCE